MVSFSPDGVSAMAAREGIRATLMGVKPVNWRSIPENVDYHAASWM